MATIQPVIGGHSTRSRPTGAHYNGCKGFPGWQVQFHGLRACPIRVRGHCGIQHTTLKLHRRLSDHNIRAEKQPAREASCPAWCGTYAEMAVGDGGKAHRTGVPVEMR